MKILMSQLYESILLTLPSGEHLEITMLIVEGEDVLAAPDLQNAVDMLFQYTDFLATAT